MSTLSLKDDPEANRDRMEEQELAEHIRNHGLWLTSQGGEGRQCELPGAKPDLRGIS